MNVKPGFQWKLAHVFAIIISVALWACLLTAAFADDKTFTWIAPTTYTNGDPLDPLQDLEQYQLGCGPIAGDRTTFVRMWFDTAPTSRVETFTPQGAYFCALRVKEITALGGDFSAWSNEVNFTITAEPSAPSGLAVN